MALGPCYSWGLKADISEDGCNGTEEELLPHSCVCHLCEPQRQDQLSCPVRIQASTAVNKGHWMFPGAELPYYPTPSPKPQPAGKET